MSKATFEQFLNDNASKKQEEEEQFNPEKEKPSRWSFLKILREHSDLRLFYPEINPNAEVYKMRDNLYCIYYDVA